MKPNKCCFSNHFQINPGVEVVVNHEGGFAATIVSLFAIQKVQFRTEVPEQVIARFVLLFFRAGLGVLIVINFKSLQFLVLF